MQLGDITCRAGELTVRGKARCQGRLPSPADDVVDALADHLVDGRPGCEDRHVFLTARGPKRPIRPDVVSDTVRRA